MNFSVPSKKAYLLGGLGAVGTPALCYGGWKIYEGTVPTLEDLLNQENRRKKTLSADLSPEGMEAFGTSKTPDNKFLFREEGCFTSFFPGVYLSKFVLPANVAEPSAPQIGDVKPLAPNAAGSAPTQGCALVQFSYKSDNHILFKSEMTIKNEKAGWSLWTGYKKMGSPSEGLIYYLTFLEKTESGWSVAGGYAWYDRHISVSEEASNLRAKAPDNAAGWSVETTNEWTHRRYAGTWESTSGSDGKEFFGDVGLFLANDNEYNNDFFPQVFAGQRPSTRFVQSSMNETSPIINVGYRTTFYRYRVDADRPGWSYLTSAVDVGATLQSWYQPFENLKGKWTEVEHYCKTIDLNRKRVGADELERIKGLCYYVPRARTVPPNLPSQV